MGNAGSHKDQKENLPPYIRGPDGEDLGSPIAGEPPQLQMSDGNTPVLLKSRAHIMALVDPRSPTQEISRTPIALEDQKNGKRGSLLNPKLAMLKDSSTPNTSLNPFVDPRSPTEDIDRTPIRYAKGKEVHSTKINFQS